MHRKVNRPGPLAVLVVVGLLCASCGARWSDEQQALMESRRNGIGGAQLPQGSEQAPRSSPPTSTAGVGSSQPIGPTDAGGPSGVAAPAGEATGEDAGGGGEVAAAARPCSAPTTAPGVTDDAVAVGAINSLSGPVPGLGASYLAATQAYVAYRNSTGGVCGRQVRVLSADDGLDNARYRAALLELDPQTIGIVTGIAGGGDGGASVAEERGIPMTGTPITPEMFESPVVFGMRPSYADYDAPTPRFQYHHQQGIRRAAIVFLNAAVTPAEAQRHRQLMEAAGIEVVLYRPLPLSTLSYDSTARSIANSGADYVFALLEEGGSASLARALKDIDYQPLAQEYPVAYGSRFPELAGDAAEGASSWIDVLPIEDGGVNPEQAQFVRWMEQTAPGTSLDVFASLGWVATKAFLDSLEALPGPITRDAFLAQLRSTRKYDAGGMLGPIDLGAQVNGGCLIGMIYRGGGWQRVTPQEGFLC